VIPIGAHVRSDDPLGFAAAAGADIFQMFLDDPQSWKKPRPRADAEALRNTDVDFYVHAPYPINVVSDNNRVRIPSRKTLANACEAAAQIGAQAVIVHGGHLTNDDEPLGEGFVRWRKALDAVDVDIPIYIENTAGGDRAMARRVDVIKQLWEEIGDLGVGFCLDTCHAWAGGEPMDEVVERILDATGRIDLVHCNDSRDGFDSRRDRHANLGTGEIPPDALVEVVRKANAPVIVETPGGPDQQGDDIAWLRHRLSD